MAKLDPYKYFGVWNFDPRFDVDYDEYETRIAAMFEAIPKTHVVSLPIPGGYAYYFVKHFENPTALQHIPYGGHQVHPVIIAALSAQDVRDIIAASLSLKAVFERAGQ